VEQESLLIILSLRTWRWEYIKFHWCFVRKLRHAKAVNSNKLYQIKEQKEKEKEKQKTR